MSVSEIALKQRALVMFSLVLAMVAGLVSYFTLPAREDPQITIRESVVSTSYANMKASDVERLVTRPLEQAIVSLPELDEIRSTSIDGMSIIHVKAQDKYSDLDQVWDELAESVAAAAAQLPKGAGTPVVNDEFGDVAVYTLALWSEEHSLADVFDEAQIIRNKLVFEEGTRRVDLHGKPEEVFYVDINESLLHGAGLSMDDVASALQQYNNYQQSGQINRIDYSMLLHTATGLDSVEKIRSLAINTHQQNQTQQVRLEDIADVTKTLQLPSNQQAYFDGKRAIVLAISMQPEESVINYSARMDRTLSTIQSTMPPGIHLDIITRQAEAVEKSVYGVSINVIQTLCIVLAVVIAFLGMRTGLVVGAIVPGVMLVTLAIMRVADMQLERMSLATLVIALGLLVDNGIVVAEYFKRRFEDHGDKRRALQEVGSELALPLLSSTATTVVVFIPLMLAQHPAGEFTRNISLVILISLSASWVLAMTVTPLLCYWFLKADEKPSRIASLFDKLEPVYKRAVTKALDYRKSVVIGSVVMFIVGVGLIKNVPAQFFPSSDRTQLLAYINTPAGSSSIATENAVNVLSDALYTFEDVNSVASYVGYGGPRFILSLTPLDPAPNTAFMLVDVKLGADAKLIAEQMREKAQKLLPDTSFRISTMFVGPSDPTVLQAQVKGPDPVVVFENSKKLKEIFESEPGMTDIWSNWLNMSMRLHLEINQRKATDAGVTEAMIMSTLSNKLNGRLATVARQDDDNVPIILRGSEPQDVSPDDIENVYITSPRTGEAIPLSSLVTVNYQPGFPRIEKEDGVPTVTIEGRNLFTSPEDIAPAFKQQLDALQSTLPAGYVVEFDGIIADSKRGKAALAANFPLAFGAILMILIAQFKGYLRPLVVLLTVPLIVFGAGTGLVVLQGKFGFIVILGLLALSGIIVNNAIVLIDRIDMESQQNVSRKQAIISAATLRMRPILITTITTIVGLLPLIVAKDVLFFAMASAMAFGLGVGTILTLFVVPVLYDLLMHKASSTS